MSLFPIRAGSRAPGNRGRCESLGAPFCFNRSRRGRMPIVAFFFFLKVEKWFRVKQGVPEVWECCYLGGTKSAARKGSHGWVDPGTTPRVELVGWQGERKSKF